MSDNHCRIAKVADNLAGRVCRHGGIGLIWSLAASVTLGRRDHVIVVY
tara:strand:- start:20691 stop:20834 length:144 start_codon:yes stop_codon:yes gene_type:complete